VRRGGGGGITIALGAVKVIAGLGNPGRAYVRTPHNVGFMAVEGLANRLACRLRASFRVRARIGKAALGQQEILLVEPQTYVNNSGAAVAPLLRRHGLAPSDLLVIVDDADLPLGSIRIRRRGSSAGHKGLQSLATALGTEDFERLRIGIGRGAPGQDLVEHVLERFTAQEWETAQKTVERAVDAIVFLLEQGVDKAMNRFNAKAGEPGPGNQTAGGNSE
jgi:PTH1 family peptidyl-tRNA hydrolase